MKRQIFTNRLPLFACLLSLALLAMPAAAQSGCAVAHNLVHCPIGAAQLQAPPNGSQLLVTNLGSEGDDGVSTEFDTATHWRAQMSVGEPASVLTFRALQDGSTTAASSFRIEPDTDPVVEMRTGFTGAAGPHTYRLIVLDDGQQVASFDGLDQSSIVVINRFPVPEPIPSPSPWPWPDFKRGPLGACGWEFQFDGDMTYTMPSGAQATGDAVRLVENVGSGHYLYSGFTSITMQSDASSLTIDNEEISN